MSHVARSRDLVEPRVPRHPRRRRRRRVLCGSVFLLLATNTGARLGLPARAHRPVRLDDDHGHRLVDVRHRLQGPGPDLEGDRGQRTATSGQADRRGRTTLPEPDALPDPAEVLDEKPSAAEGVPRRRQARRASATSSRSDPDLADELKQQTGQLALLPSVGQGHRRDPGRGGRRSWARTARNLFAAADRLRDHRAPSRPAASRSAPTRPMVGRIKHKLRTAFTLKNPPAYAVVQLQQAIPQETKPGQAPPIPVADPTSRSSRSIMERDLGALRLPLGRRHRLLRHRVRPLRQRAAPARQGGHARPGRPVAGAS